MDEIAGEKIFGRYDRFLIIILLLGLIMFAAGANLASQIGATGPRGEYANLAWNIVNGKGFTLDYLDEYYIKFDSITHPMEWDYPMMGILIAPFMLLLGKISIAPALPTLLIGTIFFPVLVYYIGKEFFDRKIGFLSAVSILFYWPIFDSFFNGYRDIPFAFFLLAGIYFFYKGLKEEKYNFYLMGIFLGISYLVRPTTLVIFPVLILAYYLIKRKLDFSIIKGILVAVLVISPWLIRNYIVFGDPFFTANRYAQWIFGWFNEYEILGYKVYWNAIKPSFSWTMSFVPNPFATVAVKIAKSLAAQFELFLYLTILAFAGLAVTSKEKIGKLLLACIVFITMFAIILKLLFLYYLKVTFPLILIFALPYLLMLAIANIVLAKDSPKIRVFALFWLAFALIHGFYVFPEVRFLLPLVPFFLIFAWKGISHVLGLLARDLKWFKKEYAEKVLAAVLIIFILLNMLPIYSYMTKEKTENPLVEQIKKGTENDAVIMACSVGSLNFYTGRKALELPGDNIERTAEVIKTYNVSYISFAKCGVRPVAPQLYRSIIGTEEPLQADKDRLYRINLNEITQGGKKIVSFGAQAVG